MGAKRRSSKKSRDLEGSRKEILEVAFLEVFSSGFQGVSIDDIVAKTNLTKGAFFHQFPTKLDMGYALVDEVIKPMIIDRWIKPLQFYENPLDGVLAQLKTLIGDSDPIHLRLGCPLNNLVQEMSSIDKKFHKRLQIALNLWIDEMDQHLKRAKKSGFLKADVNTKQVAHFVVMAHEGFYGMLKGLNDPKIFSALYASLKLYFKAISKNAPFVKLQTTRSKAQKKESLHSRGSRSHWPHSTGSRQTCETRQAASNGKRHLLAPPSTSRSRD